MQKPVVIAALALALAVAGCAPSPRYVIGSSEELTAREAEAAYLRKELVRKDPDGRFDQPVRAIHAPMPDYPVGPNNVAHQGRVVLRFTVTEDGHTANPVVVSAPHGDLARAVVEAVSRWQFEPLTERGKPVRPVFQMPFDFALPKSAP